MHEATLLLTVFFVVVTVTYLSPPSKIKRNGQRLSKAPNTLPFVGNGIKFLQDRHKLFSWFVKCEQKFGFETFEISVPSLPPGVVINNPANLEHVLKNEGIFSKGEFFKKRSFSLFGNGIINADGELWKVQRKAGLHFLSSKNLKAITEVSFPGQLKHMVEELREKASRHTVVDLEAVFLELTTQLMGRMAYGMEMHNSDPFSSAFDYASGKTGERFQNPLWQATEPLLGSSFRKSLDVVRTFGSTIVKNAVCSRQKKENEFSADERREDASGSLINSLLDSIDDHQIVADAALNYLSAGRDTTAQALTWAFYLLMRNPHVVTALQREVALVASHSTDVKSAVFKPSSMPYTLAVFYEALRLYPVIPFELRQCQEDTVLPDGTFLPKSAVLIWCSWAMNRSKLIWGSEPEVFEPNRWLVDGRFVSRTAYEYPVFNGGTRTCLGKTMAESMAVQAMATMVLHFDFKSLDDKERISKNSLTLPMEGGLPCHIETRLDNL